MLFPLFTLLLFIAGCSSRTAPQASPEASSGEVQLTINAAPRQGFTPLRVTFRGELAGVDQNDQEYYCLQEIWDFGDGSKSSEKQNCEPYSPDSKVKREFFSEHVYEKEGRYTIRLMLGEEDNEKVRSRPTGVTVIERITMDQWEIRIDPDQAPPDAVAK